MRRMLREMGTLDIIVWVLECLPGAALISLVLTISASILLDFPLEFSSLTGLALYFLPGFLVGLLVMMAISYFLGSVFRGLLGLLGWVRR
jgi:hypothetical protein